MKTFWLSFCDPDKPVGERFMGVAVVDVEGWEADEAFMDVFLRFPNAQQNAEWIAAATQKARREGCNPGGEVIGYELPPDHPNTARCPRNRLLTKAALIELNLM